MLRKLKELKKKHILHFMNKSFFATTAICMSLGCGSAFAQFAMDDIFGEMLQNNIDLDINIDRPVCKVNWYGSLKPCTSKNPIALLDELPAVPSASSLANPKKEEILEYMKAISRVEKRVEELVEKEELCLKDYISTKRDTPSSAESLSDIMKGFSENSEKSVADDSGDFLSSMFSSALSGLANAMGSLSPALGASIQLNRLNEKNAQMYEYVLYQPSSTILFPSEATKKVNELKKKIGKTDSPKEYDRMFDEAISLIGEYRNNAIIQVRKDIQQNINDAKALMSDFLKIQRDAVKDGTLPECAAWIFPYYAIIEAGNLLYRAYSEIPYDYPSLYETKVLRTISGDEAKSEMEKAKNVKQKSYTWTSTNGNRTATFNADGGFLLLPEGDFFDSNKLLSVKTDNPHLITWLIIEPGDEDSYNVVMCTYKI